MEHCGKTYPNDFKYCPECGSKLKSIEHLIMDSFGNKFYYEKYGYKLNLSHNLNLNEPYIIFIFEINEVKYDYITMSYGVFRAEEFIQRYNYYIPKNISIKDYLERYFSDEKLSENLFMIFDDRLSDDINLLNNQRQINIKFMKEYNKDRLLKNYGEEETLDKIKELMKDIRKISITSEFPGCISSDIKMFAERIGLKYY